MSAKNPPAQAARRSSTAADGWIGRYFEDFAVGDRYQHRLGRTITTVDNLWFTLLTLNTNPLHFDHHYASQTQWRRPIVNSCFTLALVTGMSVPDVSQNALANLGWDAVKLTHPVYEGDTIYAESDVLATRPSSRPEAGIVLVRTRGFNQDGVVVIEFNRTMMIYRRSHAPRPPRPPRPAVP